jgi:hypothetical protein
MDLLLFRKLYHQHVKSRAEAFVVDANTGDPEFDRYADRYNKDLERYDRRRDAERERRRRKKHDDGDGGDDEDSDAKSVLKKLSIGVAIMLVVCQLLFGGLAAYLSWTSNTLVGWHVVFKVIFALFAFFWWFTYLLAFLLHRLDFVWFIRTGRSGVAAAAAAGQDEPVLQPATTTAAAPPAAPLPLPPLPPAEVPQYSPSPLSAPAADDGNNFLPSPPPGGGGAGRFARGL